MLSQYEHANRISSQNRPHHFFDLALIFCPVFGSVMIIGFLYKLAMVSS